MFGASVLLAEGGKPETAKTESEHAARRDPMIPGHEVDMAHEGGAFKVNSATRASAVKKSSQPDSAYCPVQNPNDQNSCNKFSQIAAFA